MLPTTFVWFVYKVEAPTTFSSGSINVPEQVTEVREILMFISLLKDMIHATDEWPGEETHRMRSGRVLSTGASVLVELGGITLLVHMCSPTWKLSEAHTSGILWKLPYDYLLSPFAALSPLWGRGCGAENSKLSIMTCSFWWPAPSSSPPRAASLEPKMLLS